MGNRTSGELEKKMAMSEGSVLSLEKTRRSGLRHLPAGLWGTVPCVGNVAQPHLEKPVGSEVGGQDPHPWISSPVGNQACIVPRLL